MKSIRSLKDLDLTDQSGGVTTMVAKLTIEHGRRELLAALSGAAVAWPLSVRAQQRALPTIGLLSSRSPAVDASLIALIRQGLNGTGFVEGQNVALDYRWAEGQYDRLAGLAADLVRKQVAVIVTIGGEQSALAAKTATETIPIVFTGSTDPIKIGLVASVNRPGGNITGMSTFMVRLSRSGWDCCRSCGPPPRQSRCS